LVVPDLLFESLPVHVLVTDLPPNSDGVNPLRTVEWLAKRPYAVSMLPAVSSLRALRQLANKAKPSRGFIGFGNPVLGGDRAVHIAAVTLNWRGMLADVNKIRSLMPLPDTATELEQLARSLATSRRRIFLGPNCTERQVKALSASGDLEQARVVVFATHGAMAGELKGFNEPGLVMTPPEQATEEDDGLLTASEVAQLNLNANWVILSACNSAAADGTPGARGFSGLARAFFYAGARALLVSHWSVRSEAAVRLTTGMVGYLKRRPGMGRADALRRTMIDLIENGPEPDPAFWAPFVMVGD
jgi:CHAT domain-containing protein